jgi:predicted ATPase
VEAYWALGSTLFMLGEFGAAQVHLTQSLTLYDAQRHHSHVFLYGTEPGIYGLSYLAWALWHLGYPDQALQKSQAALTLAQELSHLFSLAGAQNFTAQTHELRRERAPAQEWAEATITLAHEHGFPNWVGQGTLHQGWALAEQGQVEEGISQIRQGLAILQAVGTGLFRSYYLAQLAAAYGKVGQVEEGFTTLTEALATVDKTGERWCEAELHRLKGELMLRTSGQSRELRANEAEACFHKAIDIARRQQAKSLELRAVMSLSRLWQQQDKQKEAHALLAEIYNWFTEGFDTKDLQEAKALLEQLT